MGAVVVMGVECLLFFYNYIPKIEDVVIWYKISIDC